MEYVRRFVESDIPQVAALHRTVFHTAPEHADRYAAYFRDVYLDNPSRNSDLPSLVYEQNGRIGGFLGVVPRRLRMGSRRLQAAVSSQFIVGVNGRSGIVAVQLARTFLDGRQDVSIADEANDAARKLWEALGGAVALLPSIHWIRPLRPARLALSLLRRRPALRPLAMLASPVASVVDALTTTIPSGRFCPPRPNVFTRELSTEAVLAVQQECAPGSLTVEYDGTTFAWLLARATQAKPGCRLHTAAISGKDGKLVGWYVYALNRDGTAEVLQLAANRGPIEPMLDDLFYRAWRQGAIAVGGRLDSRFLPAVSDKYCLFHRRGPWMLVHARRPDVVRAFQAGDVFFSRLDGEWCLRF
jgi:hypothetical protein